MNRAATWTLTIVLAAIATQAAAGTTPGQKCQAAKNKAAGKYAACRQAAEQKLALYDDAAAYGEAIAGCESKLSQAWQKAVDQAAARNAACFDDSLSEADFKAALDTCSDGVAAALAGGELGDCDGDLATCTADLATCDGGLTSCGSDLSSCDGDLGSCNASLSTCSSNLGAVSSNLSTCTNNLGSCNGSLATCGNVLTAANSSLSTCTSDLGSCNVDLGSCNANVGSCQSDLGDCQDDLAACAIGTATAADVLAGKTFSSAAGAGAAGTMPDNGAQVITPGTTDQQIAAGYHDGNGVCQGDSDLVADNVRNGVQLFGITGARKDLPKTGSSDAPGSSNYYQGLGSDADVEAGNARVFTDNADGTITDEATGLMWEKKRPSDLGPTGCQSEAQCPDPHDVDHLYSADMRNPISATARTVFLTQLNARCSDAPAVPCSADIDCSAAGGLCGFAGHRDWRLPNVNELFSLLNFDFRFPKGGNNFPAFAQFGEPGCALAAPDCSTYGSRYWSSTGWSGSGYWVNPGDVVTPVGKDNLALAMRVRAVRGGL